MTEKDNTSPGIAYGRIQKLCTRGGCVVDFFLGSGTTAVAAAELGRRFIGYEINAGTIERAARRIAP